MSISEAAVGFLIIVVLFFVASWLEYHQSLFY